MTKKRGRMKKTILLLAIMVGSTSFCTKQQEERTIAAQIVLKNLLSMPGSITAPATSPEDRKKWADALEAWNKSGFELGVPSQTELLKNTVLNLKDGKDTVSAKEAIKAMAATANKRDTRVVRAQIRNLRRVSSEPLHVDHRLSVDMQQKMLAQLRIQRGNKEKNDQILAQTLENHVLPVVDKAAKELG